MALSKKELGEFKNILNKRLEEIKKELGDFAHRDNRTDGNFVSDFPDYGDKEDENAQEVKEYMDRLSLESTFEKELRDVKESLLRIEDKTYGICKYCHKDIGVERLKIRPTSSSCVKCKKEFKGEA